MVALPEEVFAMTSAIADAPDAAEEIEISFAAGNPAIRPAPRSGVDDSRGQSPRGTTDRV